MARRRQHIADNDPDESAEDLGSTPMSPNTKRKEALKRIMDEDLGQATADHITTSDYPAKRTSNLRVIPNADREGTEEAKIASANAAKTNTWRAWGNTDEAKDTAAGWEPLAGGADGNSHRYRAQQEKLTQERDLGRQVSLNDTYDERAFRTATAPRGRRSSLAARQLHVVNNTLPTPPKGPKKARRGFQARQWPPFALLGTPAFPTTTSSGAGLAAQALPSTNTPSEDKETGSKAVHAGLATAYPPKAEIAASSQASRLGDLWSRNLYGDFLSSAPSAFVSQTANFFASGTKNEQTQLGGTKAATAAAAQQPLPGTKDTSQHLSTAGDTRQANALQKVPISEFTFSADTALAKQGDASDLMGLGIQNADDGSMIPKPHCSSLSNSGAGLPPHDNSIMDSPILDNVNNDVLPAGKGKIVVINGVRYVPESELLALKHALAVLIGNDDSLLDTRTSASKISLPTAKANPFTPREPAVTDGAKVPVLPSSTEAKNETHEQKTTMSLDEAIVRALRPQSSNFSSLPVSAPSPVEAAVPAPPVLGVPGKPQANLSSNTIISRWAPVAAPSSPVEATAPLAPLVRDLGKSQVTTSTNTISKWANVAPSSAPTIPKAMRPVGSVSSGNRNTAPAMQPKATTSGRTHAPSVCQEQSGSAREKSATVNPPIRSSDQLPKDTIIGDRQVFGHLSEVAAAGLFYDNYDQAPRPKKAAKRKTHGTQQPGPGFTALLEDLQQRASTLPVVQEGALSFGMLGPNEQRSGRDSDQESEL